MKGATEELYVKLIYYKKREGLGSPQWHFTMHIPQCFSQILFWKKGLLKNVILIFQNIKKALKDGFLFAKCQMTIFRVCTVYCNKKYIVQMIECVLWKVTYF